MSLSDSCPDRRSRTGKIAGIAGIVCNTLLSAGKLLVGYLSGSMSVAADGWNNLSDGASSLVTLLAFRMAEKPADRHHPFGHARLEYLASLCVSMLTLVIGLELGTSAIKKLLHPVPIVVSPVMLGVLLASVGVKLALMLAYRRMGREIQSGVLLACAADSRNDVITTLSVILAAILEKRTGWMLDGAMGLAVSVFILLSGLSMARDTVSTLLGEGADPALRQELTDYIQARPQVLGCHDLMVHDYGPGQRYASIHVEMDRQEDALVCHETIDKLERESLSRFGVHLVIHYDPVENDPETLRLKALLTTIVHVRDSRLELHDFRVLPEGEVTRLRFDLTVPEALQGQEEALRDALAQALAALEPKNYTLEITFDLAS